MQDPRQIKEQLTVDWQRVLFRLWIARRNNERFNLATNIPGGEWISGGYLPIYVFQSAHIGGSAGGRRLRDLRDHMQFAIPIHMKVHDWELSRKAKHTPIYRLDCDYWLIDWDQVVQLGAKYRYPLATRIPQITEDENNQRGIL